MTTKPFSIEEIKYPNKELFEKDPDAFYWLCERFQGRLTKRQVAKRFRLLYRLVPDKENREVHKFSSSEEFNLKPETKIV